MKDNNIVLDVVVPLVAKMPTTYNQIIYQYQSRANQPLGLVDCGIYALAIAEFCKNKTISIEQYIVDNRDKWHVNTYLYLMYSFIDIAITLKLNNIPALANYADIAYERSRVKGLTPDIRFMYYYMQGWLLIDSVDNDKIKKEHNTEWFRICLLALENFKKAQKIAILEDVDMPIREALLALQIQTIHFAMVEPQMKKGFTLSGINTLAYNHSVPAQVYRNIAESACSYLGNIYRKQDSAKIVTRPYEFSPNAIMGL